MRKILFCLVAFVLFLNLNYAENKSLEEGLRGTLFLSDISFQKTITMKRTQVFSLDESLNKIEIGSIKKNTEIIVLGIINFYQANRSNLYLVKELNSKTLWTGLIDQSDISIKSLSGIFNLSCYNISPNNQYLVMCSDDEIILLNKVKGKQLLVSRNEYQNKINAKTPVHFSPIGWSENSNFIWIELGFDSGCLGYLRIETNDNSYRIIDLPFDYKYSEIEINYNNGNVIYSNYPVVFDADTQDSILKSEEVFSLYKGNLLSHNFIEVAKNTGQGFILKKDNKSNLYYQKNMDVPQTKVIF